MSFERYREDICLDLYQDLEDRGFGRFGVYSIEDDPDTPEMMVARQLYRSGSTMASVVQLRMLEDGTEGDDIIAAVDAVVKNCRKQHEATDYITGQRRHETYLVYPHENRSADDMVPGHSKRTWPPVHDLTCRYLETVHGTIYQDHLTPSLDECRGLSRVEWVCETPRTKNDVYTALQGQIPGVSRAAEFSNFSTFPGHIDKFEPESVYCQRDSLGWRPNMEFDLTAPVTVFHSAKGIGADALYFKLRKMRREEPPTGTPKMHRTEEGVTYTLDNPFCGGRSDSDTRVRMMLDLCANVERTEDVRYIIKTHWKEDIEMLRCIFRGLEGAVRVYTVEDEPFESRRVSVLEF